MITGGAGFIARNLTEQLGDRHRISAPARAELDLMDAEAVAAYLKRHRFDVVIHAATYDAAPKHSTKDPRQVLESNLRMFFNVARRRDDFGKMIFFGSGAEFGREHWIPKMSEEYFDAHVPSDQYGFSKYLMTKHALAQDRIYNLRLFGLFGKYDDWRTRFIPNACCYAVLGLPVRMEQNKFRDFLHIDDLAAIVEWFLGHSPEEKVFNACAGRTFEYQEIARTISTVSGKNWLDVRASIPGLGTEYSGDNRRLLKVLKGFQFTSFEKSLEALYRWYDENKRLIEVDKL